MHRLETKSRKEIYYYLSYVVNNNKRRRPDEDEHEESSIPLESEPVNPFENSKKTF